MADLGTETIWEGKIRLIAWTRLNEKKEVEQGLTVDEDFNTEELGRILKRMKNPRMARAVLYGFIGTIEEVKFDLMTLELPEEAQK